MARDKLTADSVGRLPYLEKPYHWCVHWDPKLAGFGVRVTKAKVRSYIVSYRLRGTRAKRLRTLGAIEKLTLPEARDLAREVLREALSGRDWFDAVKRERAQTLGQVWKYYSDEHLAGGDVSDRTRGDAKLLWEKHCRREFEFAPLIDVSPERARDWHRRTSKSGPYVANRAAQALRASWNYGIKYNKVPRELSNPFAAIELNSERARQTILEPHQFPAFAKAVDAIEEPFARAYVWLLFYTGCRRTELLKLTWSDVEILPERKGQLRTGTITLRHTKGGEERRVALSPPAVSVIEAIARTENPHVFVGSIAGTHLDPKPHWQLARRAAGLPKLRMHDLRRSFGSWLGASGFAPKLIGAALGHRTDITSRVYVQLGEAAGIKRQLAEAHAALAHQFGQEKPKARVIKLAKARA
jgi:integrase